MDFFSQVEPGDVIGGYRVLREVGAGGMGTVYEVERIGDGGRAAIKVLSPWLGSELGRKRFEREIQACARLRHPNTVRIFEWGESTTGLLYYTMEYLNGHDLAALVKRFGAQPAGRVIHIISQVANALDEAHSNALVHRDIKPPNIVLVPTLDDKFDVAKLVDFGLVKPMERATRLTVEGEVLGSPRYMAPEMIRRADADARSDFYALGLVAYYLLAGRPPFDGPSPIEILELQREAAPPPINEAPEDLMRVIHHCLEKEPEHRPASAAAIREALAQCADASAWGPGEAEAWWMLNTD